MALYLGSQKLCPTIKSDIGLSRKIVSGTYSMPENLYYLLPAGVTDLGAYSLASGLFGDTILKYVTLNVTKITGASALLQAFGNCTSLQSLSFPNLTSALFGGTYSNQFKDMLTGVTGCTVHFPSNLQSALSNNADVIIGFSGTSTTILYDLPATT